MTSAGRGVLKHHLTWSIPGSCRGDLTRSGDPQRERERPAPSKAKRERERVAILSQVDPPLPWAGRSRAVLRACCWEQQGKALAFLQTLQPSHFQSVAAASTIQSAFPFCSNSKLELIFKLKMFKLSKSNLLILQKASKHRNLALHLMHSYL